MTQELVARSEQRNYSDLFRLDLNWGSPDQQPVTLQLDGETYAATNVSTYQGLRVWEIPCLPGSAVEAKLDQLLAKSTTNRLVIFHDADKQAWRWPSRTVRGTSVSSRPARHVHTTGSPDAKFASKLEAICLPDDIVLDANEVLAKVRGAFDVETKNETRRASKLMARMYTAVERAYPTEYDAKKRDHEISVSLARILFLLFGDDTEMWTTELFLDFIKDHTSRDGSDIGPRLNALFQVLDTPPASRTTRTQGLSAFPYVNGGIFEERITLPDLDQDFRDAVLDAAAVDWSTISPAIFGSMFQSVRDAQTRRELGEHYTSEENILKTLNPLFLDELRAEFEAALSRDTARKKSNALHALWKGLGDIRYLDPACGCGNFIIVAYRELRAIELDIMLALQDLSGSPQLSFDPTLDLRVTLDHFFGIEIDEWPVRIAETAMFLIDRQCDLRLKERFGEAPQRLPIQREASIVVGNALTEVDWAELIEPSERVMIAGNPPFLGISLRSAQQTSDLKSVWADQYHGTLDYVTGWYARAVQYFGDHGGRWALVSTNSIMQGEAVAPLFRPVLNEGWQIRFAHRTFKWTSEAGGAAAVHCVIIGFERDPKNIRLFAYDTVDGPPREVEGVQGISPYLTDSATVIIDPMTRPLNPQLGEVAYGNKPTDGGCLIVDREEYNEVAEDQIAAKYLRTYVGARELLHGSERYCLWLAEASAGDMQRSPILRERIAGVRAFRLDSKAASTRAAADSAHIFRQVAQPATPYLCIPRHVTETRPYFLSQRYDASVICSDATFLTPDPDGFEFAIISSSMFITWQRTVGGRIKSDLRFNKLLTWNTFPLPPVSTGNKRRIIEGGEKVLAARERQAGTPLAAMYPPTGLARDLKNAHDALDAAVDGTFGAAEGCELSELARQEILFDCYLQMTACPSAEPNGTRVRR